MSLRNTLVHSHQLWMVSLLEIGVQKMNADQERLQRQLQRANGEAMKKQQEYEQERKDVEKVREEDFDAVQWIRKMSKGTRGGIQ